MHQPRAMLLRAVLLRPLGSQQQDQRRNGFGWKRSRASGPQQPSGSRPRRCLRACAAPPKKSLAAQLIDLRAALSEAVVDEDYALAAALRDQIRELEAQDPETVLGAEIARAVEQQRFEDAALLKSKLTELQEASPTQRLLGRTRTSSEAVTEGIRVTAESFYVPGASSPEEGRYLFAYHVRIRNDSARTVKLVERRWEVTNDLGQIHEMRGEGVVGRQPELGPGQSFFYQATCPLSTPVGAMKGTFEMYVKNEASQKWTSSFLAEVGAFGLDWLDSEQKEGQQGEQQQPRQQQQD